MDLETENGIATYLMKEAAELRRQDERDGVDAYFRPSNVRARPNSRFLTATVLGVQQANRIVEVNEMWKIHQKEKELDDRVKKNDKRNTCNSAISFRKNSSTTRLEDYERKSSYMCSSNKRGNEDDVLRDQEIEEFLHSRVKRGRGSVGSRMDETGPYLSGCKENHQANTDEGYRENDGVILGPEKPFNMKSSLYSDDESCGEREKRPKRNGSSKHNHKKRSSKEKSRDIKKKKREKRRNKHFN